MLTFKKYIKNFLISLFNNLLKLKFLIKLLKIILLFSIFSLIIVIEFNNINI